jgi:hypothetical protein
MTATPIETLRAIPGIVLGTELPNLDTFHDIDAGEYREPIEQHKPADVGTAARLLWTPANAK